MPTQKDQPSSFEEYLSVPAVREKKRRLKKKKVLHVIGKKGFLQKKRKTRINLEEETPKRGKRGEAAARLFPRGGKDDLSLPDHGKKTSAIKGPKRVLDEFFPEKEDAVGIRNRGGSLLRNIEESRTSEAETGRKKPEKRESSSPPQHEKEERPFPTW